ncbi:MAG: Gliding motility-associated C-terminal protein, partial [Sediminibacterium sp.]|nr:Gliding motility-associated C-terminal protein [Sediminibacterium sp.]
MISLNFKLCVLQDLAANPDEPEMKNIKCLFCLLLLFAQSIVSGQDFSNKGTDFWLGYGYHVNMAGAANGGSQDLKLYFTSDKNANVKVDIPGIQYSATYTITANQVTTSAAIPKTGTQDARISNVGLYDKGIHITSDVPIVAYAHIYNASVSGATLLFPTNTLGKDYYSVNYTQSSNNTSSNSFFFVVATEDNTTVEITPSAPNVNGLTVGSPFMITLNKGQIYNVMGTVSSTAVNSNYLGSDLTGSRIRSVSTNGSGGCKKIAVFSGSGKINIGNTQGGSADNLIAQAFPAVAWGKKYLTAPTGTQPNNFYRVCVTDPATVVKLNGNVLPASSLINGFYYQFKNGNAGGTNSPVPNLIEANRPVLVAQYCTTQGAEGNPSTVPGGDPEMIYLSPVEQTINNITLYSAAQNLILQSYINVIIKAGGVASFTLDGAKVNGFLPHPQDNTYSYVILPVGSGSHTLYSDTGFNAIAYGFGSAESYGYNAGTNVRDFTPVATFQNPYSRIDSAVTCVNTPLQFSLPLAFTPATVKWDFSAAPNIAPNTTIGPSAANTPDSTKTINGQTLNYYSPGKTFTFISSNTAALRDTIKLYTTSATPDGCGSTDQVYSLPVKVNERPVAGFIFASNGCVTDSVLFTDQSTTSNGLVNRWTWDFGDGTIDNRTTATPFPKKYGAGGNYTIKLKAISDIGCISDESSKSILITDKPIAKFTPQAITCADNDIVFTDASTTTTGTIVKWTLNLDDGAAAFTNTTN